MGEVYRARDTKLNRDVALKVLPDVFARDQDRLARFKREAQVLASLNHPHIGAIYGFEESDGLRALVLELVEGPTLADRVAHGPMPLEDALPIARQIAEALEAAHERGVVHRDLKPANIKLTPKGTVKVLDFGLAKALGDDATTANLSNSPTMTAAVTRAGVILGTAAYMSPEQARAKAVDKRTDVWAFGCVLFEMLTGKKPFDGETLTDTVAAIVKNEPDWRALPPGTPAAVQSVIARCLRKDPAQRLHDIADGRLQLEEALNDPMDSTAALRPARSHREWAGWILAVLILAAGLIVAARPWTTSSSADPIRFPVFPPQKTAFPATINTTVNVPSFALAPDGHALAFIAQAPGAKPVLWVRSMDHLSARQLAGTEDAQNPMWDPDSRWIGFFADGKLKKVPAAGGAVQVITPSATDVRGGTWGPDDTILVGSGTGPILRVSSAGGKTTPVTFIDASRQEGTHRNPHVLPDGHHFLYSIFGSQQDHNGMYAGSLDGKTKKLLLHVNTSAVYSPPGYLLFVDGDTLLAQGFDAGRLEVKGQPFLVAEHVGRNTAFMSAVSASRTGTIAYAGILSHSGRLAWFDRVGDPIDSTDAGEGDYADFRLSPDETRLAASLVDPKTNAVEIWLTDLARRSNTLFASGGLVTASALWSPDGTQIIFRTNRNGIIEFFQRSAAGAGNDRPVLSLDAYRAAHLSQNLIPTDWSRDGHIIFSAPAPASGNDLWLLPLGEEGKTAKFIATPAEKLHGNFSPDGRLVAYTSNESGKFEVYVETFPRSDRKWPVSTSGGYEPRWRADGREIYYLSEDRKLMAVSVGAGRSFGIPKPLFQTSVPAGVTANRMHYVPGRDGQRFLVNVALDREASPITVVVNWTATPMK
jgi:serine/threonine protein kinase/Tol biopolymer transport system component